jgi:hypothetical protein
MKAVAVPAKVASRSDRRIILRMIGIEDQHHLNKTFA